MKMIIKFYEGGHAYEDGHEYDDDHAYGDDEDNIWQMHV